LVGLSLIANSIPTRRELVKNAARNPNTTEVKASQLESQTHAWMYCPISQRLLATPIVSDSAGTLYNKDAILEHLLPNEDPSLDSTKTEHEEVLGGRVKSLRDIVEVKFQTEKNDITKGERRICPITSKELGPHTKAVYIVPCGHAFSEAAVREVAGIVCLQCNEPYKTEDIISILPVAKEEIARLAARISKLKEAGLTHSLKKAPGGKKKKKHGAAESNSATNTIPTKTEAAPVQAENLKRRLADVENIAEEKSVSQSRSGTSTPAGGIKNAATASLTAKVLIEQEESNKRRKMGLNSNLKSLFSSSGYDGSKQKGGDFMTRGYSLPKRA
jgi:hypothetical protein